MPTPLRTEHGHPLAEPHLEVERVGEAVELELLDDDGPLAGACPAEAHVDALLADGDRLLGALDELAQPALGGLELGGERVGDLGSPPHLGDQGLEATTLVLVQRVVVGELVEVAAAGLGVAGEPAAVGPRPVRLHRHDLGRRRREQLPIVADVEHRLAADATSSLSSQRLAVDVEEVVGLVEQQDVVVAAQQHLEGHALLLASGERVQRTVADLREVQADGSGDALVPVQLGVVAAVIAPVGERGGVPDRVVRRALPLRRCRGGPRRRGGRGGERDEQLADRARRAVHAGAAADELAHHPDAAVDGDSARRRRQLRAMSLQQRRLPDAVGPDERDPLTVADREADVAEQFLGHREVASRRG